MWLLDVDSRKLVAFMDDRATKQKYAILSHTWEEEEVSFQEVHLPRARTMAGYRKIDFTCAQASLDGLKYAWIDTCCINKESSSELSEAINSMFRWYQNAAVCYTYLQDIQILGALMPASWAAESKAENMRRLLQSSRWFTRGWTLQELVAPRAIAFFDRSWVRIGIVDKLADSHGKRTASLRVSKSDPDMLRIINAVSAITRIDEAVLLGDVTLETCCIAQRLSWAAHRTTTRVEDHAYCLLGLLGVNMPLLYGEGAKAFIRLQETVLAATMDHSLLAWRPYALEQCHLLLAPDCYCFRLATDLVNKADPSVDPDFAITNRGLRMTLPISRSRYPGLVLARLQCRHWSDKSLLALRLRYVGPVEPKAFRRGPKPYEVVRTISALDERYWTEGCRSKWVDLVMLRTPLNVTIPVELPAGLRILSAGVGEIGKHWHSNLSEFSIPQGVYEPAFIEVMDVASRKKKVLSLLRWRLRDLIVGWSNWRAHWTHRIEGLSLGDMVLSAARKDDAKTWRIPGTTEVIDAEVWAAGMGDLPQGRELPEHTAILRLRKQQKQSDFASLWSSYSEDPRAVFTMRVLSGVMANSPTAKADMAEVVRAASVDDGALLRKLYATKISDLVAGLRNMEIMVQGWTPENLEGEAASDINDITIDSLD